MVQMSMPLPPAYRGVEHLQPDGAADAGEGHAGANHGAGLLVEPVIGKRRNGQPQNAHFAKTHHEAGKVEHPELLHKADQQEADAHEQGGHAQHDTDVVFCNQATDEWRRESLGKIQNGDIERPDGIFSTPSMSGTTAWKALHVEKTRAEQPNVIMMPVIAMATWRTLILSVYVAFAQCNSSLVKGRTIVAFRLCGGQEIPKAKGGLELLSTDSRNKLT